VGGGWIIKKISSEGGEAEGPGLLQPGE